MTQEETIDYRRIDSSQLDMLWELQKKYKVEIEEDIPSEQDRVQLARAISNNQILFYGAWDGDILIGCCSITIGFSTFNYAPSGVFEDFYICPQYRHKGIARKLVKYSYIDSGIKSLTVGCANCDVALYQSLGFSIKLGNLLAHL